MEHPAIRPATSHDAPAVVFLSSFHATYDFPLAHTDDEVRGWVADVLLPGTETWVAEQGPGAVIGVVALGQETVEQLYVAPGHTGAGIGGRLLELAKERRPAGLHLYTFQVNDGARRFYERHGFRVIELNDGSNSEERQPDVLYSWR
ncbi:MAG: GNAT family N-acetyltransferase [Geminicoccales bacterium]